MTKASNVILVHGAWADGSSWSKVIPLLLDGGLRATAVQLPLTSLKDDVATVKRAVALEDGPIVLVGHSYGGVVITEAGDDPKVAGLVDIAAFAPDIGQSMGSLGASVEPAPMGAEVRPDAQGFLKLTEAGVKNDFAQDLTPTEKSILFAAQAPTAAAAFAENVSVASWKAKPSWYLVATVDRAIMVEMNNIPFHTKPVKLRYMWRDVERRAALYELPWSAVPPYPIKHLSLVNRIALSATEEGWCADYVKAAYRAWFISGQDPSVEPSLSDNLRALGQNPDKVIARATSDEAKAALEAATSAACALGIFGSPTFVINGEIFWGDDRLEDAIRWYNHASTTAS